MLMLKKGAVLSLEKNMALHQHLESLAQKHFSISTLRPQQLHVFNSLAQSDQVLAMLPTGAGKTLIYALGSLLYESSVTIVVCPLVALMRDQQQRMSSAGIPTAVIYSEQTELEKRSSYRSLATGQCKLLFISPERFVSPAFFRFLKRMRIGMVVVDEAHCVVSWGHSFRPEYSQIGYHLRELKVSKILALTATASKASRKIIREMIFPEPNAVLEVIDKPLRENIKVEALRVFSEEERWLAVQDLLKRTKSRKTILYFQRREQCQKAAQELKKCGYNSVIYHAGLQRELRRSVEDYLRQSERPVVICATLAFGMGIDLPDVQLVAVVGFPSNIEELFQMMGRAGRQGENARAVLIWSGSDPKKRSFQFEKMLPEYPVMRSVFQSLSHFFPGLQQSRLVPRAEVAKAIQNFVKDERESSQYLETISGILSMHGAGGAQQAARSPWFVVEKLNLEGLSRCLSDLPAGPSRRRLVLEWVGQRLNMNLAFKGRFYLSSPVTEITEELQMSWERVAEVFSFYANQSELSFQMFNTTDVQSSFLFSGDFADLMNSFPRYSRWRSTLSQSLDALSNFVNSENCRMQMAEGFFSGTMGGARGFAEHSVCGRCDVCERKLKANGRNTRSQTAGGLTAMLPDHLQ